MLRPGWPGESGRIEPSINFAQQPSHREVPAVNGPNRRARGCHAPEGSLLDDVIVTDAPVVFDHHRLHDCGDHGALRIAPGEFAEWRHRGPPRSRVGTGAAELPGHNGTYVVPKIVEEGYLAVGKARLSFAQQGR
jgi:hypothetical protein